MANEVEDHVARLKQGVTAWNAWRADNASVVPNLRERRKPSGARGANLNGADLSDADLRGANLSGAGRTDGAATARHLGFAHLSDANLNEAIPERRKAEPQFFL